MNDREDIEDRLEELGEYEIHGEYVNSRRDYMITLGIVVVVVLFWAVFVIGLMRILEWVL